MKLARVSLGHGKVFRVDFNEPGVTTGWKTYDEKWWKVHCEKISHDPKNLKSEHVRVFVGKKAPIQLKFYFEDGTVLRPTPAFYELEEQYFKNGCH